MGYIGVITNPLIRSPVIRSHFQAEDIPSSLPATWVLPRSTNQETQEPVSFNPSITSAASASVHSAHWRQASDTSWNQAIPWSIGTNKKYLLIYDF